MNLAVLSSWYPAPPTNGRVNSLGYVPPYGTELDGFDYTVKNAAGTSNAVFLTYARAPVVLENDKNDAIDAAQAVTAPCEIAVVLDPMATVVVSCQYGWFELSSDGGSARDRPETSVTPRTPSARNCVVVGPPNIADRIFGSGTLVITKRNAPGVGVMGIGSNEPAFGPNWISRPGSKVIVRP